MSGTANAAMAEYWSGVGGERWLAHEAAMERQLGDVTEALLAAARPCPGERVLEVGCGTGALALRLAEAVGAEGRVLAVDISEPLLARARIRAPGVEFLLADAQSGPLGDAHDLAASRFGVMFFDDPARAFANIRRSLRPGGRLCFVCWAPVAGNPAWAIPLAAAAARLGPPGPQPEGAPGPLSLADAGRTLRLLAEAGYADGAVGTRTVRTQTASLEEAVELSTSMGPAGALIRARQADAAAVADIQAEVRRGFSEFATADGASVPASIHVVTATNPPG